MQTYCVFCFPDKIYKPVQGKPIQIDEAPNCDFFYIRDKGYLIFEVSTGSKFVSEKSKTLKEAVQRANTFLAEKKTYGILIEPLIESHIKRYGISPKLIQTK